MEFHVIKENDLFFVSTRQGMVPSPDEDPYGFGLFTKDTRVISELKCTFDPPIFQSLSADDSDNYAASYHYANRAHDVNGREVVPRETLLATRRQFVDGERFYEFGSIRNYGRKAVDVKVQYRLAADFLDMFEVRAGQTYDRRAACRRPVACTVRSNNVYFQYLSADGIQSHTEVAANMIGSGSSQFQVKTDILREHVTAQLSHTFAISPGDTVRWVLRIHPHLSADQDHSSSDSCNLSENDFGHADQIPHQLAARYQEWFSGIPRIVGEPSFVSWYERGVRDIRMLRSDIGHGLFPVAGVPWYAVPFGRDSLITAWQCLAINAELARGTLQTMAAFQGQRVDAARDEQPGKIMHELRSGELTRLGEMPFGPYFGSVDATPLYLILAAETFKWTADRSLIQGLLPSIKAAFQWIESYGDRDGDGFVEYYREAQGGIANQGWKDSGDSIVHRNGELAMGPIALCEVQGYVYRAYQEWSAVFGQFGESALAADCAKRAKSLQGKFLDAFYLVDEQSIALALDGRKQPVRTVTSNMGQVLWSGILPETIAQVIAQRLMAADLFSGFGIRTMSSLEPAYNPISYHNGSVWPHDNALILQGLVRYGCLEEAGRLLNGLMLAQRGFPLARLPELFSGISAEEVEVPIPYPVSCSPQAWAAGTPVVACISLLGIEPTLDRQLHMRPWLPSGMSQLQVKGLAIGTGRVDLHLHLTADGATRLDIGENTTGFDIKAESPAKGVNSAIL